MAPEQVNLQVFAKTARSMRCLSALIAEHTYPQVSNIKQPEAFRYSVQTLRATLWSPSGASKELYFSRVQTPVNLEDFETQQQSDIRHAGT